jgi:hypothetical protein
MQAGNFKRTRAVWLRKTTFFWAALLLTALFGAGRTEAAPCIWLPDNGVADSGVAIDTAPRGCGLFGSFTLAGGTPLSPTLALMLLYWSSGFRE